MKKPDYEYKSAYEIDYEALKNKGIKGLIFDIDNTLVAHDAPSNEASDKLIRRLKEMEFELFILSNNDEERVQKFVKTETVDYIYKAGKPAGRNYEAALNKMGLTKSEVAAIGDQLLTDCLGAKNYGITFIKVGIIDKKEPFHIKLKRILEKVLGW